MQPQSVAFGQSDFGGRYVEVFQGLRQCVQDIRREQAYCVHAVDGHCNMHYCRCAGFDIHIFEQGCCVSGLIIKKRVDPSVDHLQQEWWNRTTKLRK